MNWCEGCKHWKPCPWHDKGYACLYILDVGHSRGCEAGEGCHHYETRAKEPPGAAYKRRLTQYYQMEGRGDVE